MTPPTATEARPEASPESGRPPSVAPGAATSSREGQARSRRHRVRSCGPFWVLRTSPSWGGWLGWHDVVIAIVMYWVTGHGITVGFHRFFTHKSFKPNRAVKVPWAIAGSMAVQGPVIRWVADHRKHHKFSDRDGDPHSPWQYGTSLGALTKGFFHAHMGWLFDPEQTRSASTPRTC